MNANQLTGIIPPELGSLTHLWGLRLNNNQLSGEIPSTIINLTNIPEEAFDGGMDLGYNRLIATNQSVRDFLAVKDPDWESTQTSIAGQITINGRGLAGVTVSLGGGVANQTTNSSGYYSFRGLAYKSYTVTPSKSGYIFPPTIQAVSVPSARMYTINFTAVPFINSQFNSSMAGWNKVTGVGWNVTNGTLISLDLGRNKYASIVYSPYSYSTLDYKVRLMRSGCNSCATSIYVRGTGVSAFGNWTNGYQFSITGNGKYLVAMNSIARLVPIQNWTTSSAIIQGSGWNVLRVVASGSSLKFYINGTLVWSGKNSTFSSGKVGIGLSSDGSTNRLYVDYATLTAT